MKLNEIKPRVINGHVTTPYGHVHMNYHDVIVKGNFSCSYSKVRSLEGSPREVHGDFYCYHTSVRTLKNIHNQVDVIKGHLSIPGMVKSHILGVLKIKGLEALIVGSEEIEAGLAKAVEIVNKYLIGKPNPRQRDIHKAQEEMIEAGLSRFAQL